MKHKRRWAWKNKHVRKHRLQLWNGHKGPPKWFIKDYHRGNRAKERLDLRKIHKGFEDVDTSPKFHPSCAGWDWW